MRQSDKQVGSIEHELEQLRVQLHSTQDQLDASNELFNTLFLNLAEEVHLWKLVKDDKGKVVTWELVDVNPIALNAWGKIREEVIGKASNEIFGYDATSQFMPIIKKVFKTGDSYKWIEYFEPTDQYLNMTTIPLGEYFISTGEDVTEKIKADQELHRSELKYRNLAENLQGIVMRYKLNADGTDELLYANKMVDEFFEVPREKAIKNVKLLWDRVHKDDVPRIKESIAKSAEDQSIWNFEYRIQLPNGRTRWVLMRGVPLLQDEESSVWDTFGFDITEKVEANEKLEHLNENLEQLVEERTKKLRKTSEELELYQLAAQYSKSGVWYYDLQKNTLKWDDIMYELYGVDREDFCEAREAWEAGLHPEDKNRAVQLLNDAIENKVPFDTLFRIINAKTKNIAHIRAKAKVEYNANGEAIAVYGTNWEVTREMQLSIEREKALKNLKEAQSQLVLSEKMASLGILTAGIAHEINNPLNYILGGYAAIQEHINNGGEINKEELQEYLHWIKTGADRASNIVRSLNLFSRSNDKENESCDLHQIIDDCILVLQHNHKDRIEINKNLTAQKHTVLGNNGRLHQVILNVLSNAIDAIEGKGVIDIRTENVDNALAISIQDNGSGISSENLHKITDPFFTTKQPGKGTGLGLSISKSIIEEHKGILSIESELNKGTTCTLHLPL